MFIFARRLLFLTSFFLIVFVDLEIVIKIRIIPLF
jgi:hypothetical protein